MTHPAFIIDNIQVLEQWLIKNGICISEGPKALGL